jgi:hypothetical protein
MTIKVTSTVDVEITITMDLRDARWLQMVMQNPLWGETPEEETEEDCKARSDFFYALKEQTDNHA